MNFFREIFNRDSDKDNILEENKQLKVKRKHTQKELDETKEKLEDITNKYIEILEEKAKGFDQYLYYQDLYGETYTQMKEYKKELAEVKMQLKSAQEELEKKSKRKGKKNEDD